MIYEFVRRILCTLYVSGHGNGLSARPGFQWITQFAYDPIDLAFANTEYQTHFLNLAYTPGIRLSAMKIAAELHGV